MKTTKLKGGSLSSTYLIETVMNPRGNEQFVRKEINRVHNREYGYMRWYSQLKKLQRLGAKFPDLFPKVLNVDCCVERAWFDIEYKKGYRDIKTILANDTLDDDTIWKMSNAVWEAFTRLHSDSYPANPNAAKLYYFEEIQQKLYDACSIKEFEDFYKLGTYEYNGEIVHGMLTHQYDLKNFFNDLQLMSENSIHGNPTLENILYSIEENKVVFIDPYEESILDSRFLDYAQVLQCSRSHYGFINDQTVTVKDYTVTHMHRIPKNFEAFNTYFESVIQEARTKQIVDVLEATQFIRMLPFKCLAGDIDKAKYFYVHACYLLGKALK